MGQFENKKKSSCEVRQDGAGWFTKFVGQAQPVPLPSLDAQATTARFDNNTEVVNLSTP